MKLWVQSRFSCSPAFSFQSFAKFSAQLYIPIFFLVPSSGRLSVGLSLFAISISVSISSAFLGGPGAIQGVKLPVALLWQMGKATGAWLWQFALHYVIRQRRQWPCAASGSPYNGPSLCPRRSATGIRCGLRVRESVSESSSSWRWHLLLIASPHVLRTQVPPPRRLNPLSAVAMHHNQRR